MSMRRNIVPADFASEQPEQTFALDRLAKTLVLAQLKRIKHGRLRLIDGDLDLSFGERNASAPFDLTVRVLGPRF